MTRIYRGLVYHEWLIPVLLIFVLDCVHYAKYVPDPQRDIQPWIQNFRQQRSFECEYQVKTRTTEVRGHSSCLPGWAEHVRGRWCSDSTVNNFEHVGLNDTEFSRINGQWQEAARGEESNLFAQIERMLNFGKFQYLAGFSSRHYQYRFKPNVPFIAPERWREITGVVTISVRNYLPVEVWAGLPDSSVWWRAQLSRFNRRKNIESPVLRWHNYQIMADSVDLRLLRRLIKKRLDLIGIPVHLSIDHSALTIMIPMYYRDSDLKDMLAPGRAVFYRVTGDKQKAVRTVYYPDDQKTPVYLIGPVFDNSAIAGGQIRFTPWSEPFLDISLNKQTNCPEEVILELDSLIVGRITLDKAKKPDKMKIKINMPYYQMNIFRAMLLQPLPVLTIIPQVGD